MKLHWYPVERQSLSALFLRSESPTSVPRSDPLFADAPDLAIGLADSVGASGVAVPAVALMGAARKEVFSWASTYAEGVFPLSQYCRVLSVEDWADAALASPDLVTVRAVNPIWPSLVLGELLGQVGADHDMASVPLSRASACFSFAMARTALLYPHQEGPRAKCLERLSSADREPRFGRRQINTESLKSVWSAALALQDAPIGQSDFVGDLLKVLHGIDPRVLPLIESHKALLSDSAEQRVMGFDLTASSLLTAHPKGQRERNTHALSLAAAALLAGRGTSHIQLLAPSSRALPEVYVWYGLLAGALGTQHWDKAWTQQSKGVERSLRQFFRIDEPVQADICWVEYEWLASTYDAMEAFTGLPRGIPSGLVIELLPGVVCQFRLSEHGTGSRHGAERAGDSAQELQPRAVSADVVSNALAMLARVQALLQGQVPNENLKAGLFGDHGVSARQKAKRGKGNAGSRSNIST